MKIQKWTAEVSMLVFEGTDSVRQTFSASGGVVEADGLPESVAAGIGKAMLVLGDKTAEIAEIAKLKKELETAKKRAELLQEAGTLTPASVSVPQLPVEPAPEKTTKKRSR